MIILYKWLSNKNIPILLNYPGFSDERILAAQSPVFPSSKLEVTCQCRTAWRECRFTDLYIISNYYTTTTDDLGIGLSVVTVVLLTWCSVFPIPESPDLSDLFYFTVTNDTLKHNFAVIFAIFLHRVGKSKLNDTIIMVLQFKSLNFFHLKCFKYILTYVYISQTYYTTTKIIQLYLKFNIHYRKKVNV